jgi:hypothetical protein
MKTSFVILLGVLCFWSDPAEARILQQGKHKNKNAQNANGDWKNKNKDTQTANGQGKQDGKQDTSVATEDPPTLTMESKDYGYASAQSLWSSTAKGYTCANIIQTFWLDVKDSVFTECESKWTEQQQSSSGNVVGSCKRGAKKFALEQIDACSNVADCYRLGIGASASVSRGFCKNSEESLEPGEAIPRKCKGLAVTTCASDAVKTIDEFFQSSVCDAVQDSTLDYVDEINKLCANEVDDKEASLQM